MKNAIYLRRKQKVLLEAGSSTLAITHVASLLKNLESLGYTLSEPLILRLQTLSIEEVNAFYKTLIRDIKKLLGAHVNWNPMYPNFPKQVMEMSDAELYYNAVLHYLSIGIQDQTGDRVQPQGWLPKFLKKKRPASLENSHLKVIDLGSEAEFRDIATRLLAANSSISVSDKEDLCWYFTHYKDELSSLLPLQIPQKETLAFMAAELLRLLDRAAEQLKNHFRTTTDVLRLAVAMSEGDVSLAENCKFRNFNRRERRFLLALLEQAGAIREDMLRYRGPWIRLGEKLHPFEYRKRYPKACKGFDTVRNNLPFETFNQKVELALHNQQALQAVELLKQRPGELARRLDHSLRLSNEQDMSVICNTFEQVAAKIAVPVLLQVMAHFKHRKNMLDFRTFFPKGSTAKAQTINNKLPTLPEKVCESIVRIAKEALMEHFAKQEQLGKVYIDPKLANYLVPFSQRSASKSLRTLVRGSRIDLPVGNTIRFFLWWKEGAVNGKQTGRVDIDLSSVLLDENWNYMEHISYTNLKSSKYRAYHSGDITAAPRGACEFIDLDIPSVVKYGGRYVVMNVNSFTRQFFSNLPECFAGWMMRNRPNSGEIFEAATVVDKLDLTTATRISIPVILDLVTRQIIWTDLGLRSHPNYQVNVEGNFKGIRHIGLAMTHLAKPNLYELFELHAHVRGELVKDKADAEIVFAEQEGITPYDIDQIMAEFMADA